MNKYFAEFIGTFVLVSVILNFPSENPVFGLAVGLALAVAIFMAGKFSGGHFNPAVSIAKYINGDISSTDVILYPLSQIIGGLVAYLLHSGGKGLMKQNEDNVQVNPVVLSDDAVVDAGEPESAPAAQPATPPEAPPATPPATPPAAPPSATPAAPPAVPPAAPPAEPSGVQSESQNGGLSADEILPQVNESIDIPALNDKTGGYGMTLIDDLDNQPIFG